MANGFFEKFKVALEVFELAKQDPGNLKKVSQLTKQDPENLEKVSQLVEQEQYNSLELRANECKVKMDQLGEEIDGIERETKKILEEQEKEVIAFIEKFEEPLVKVRRDLERKLSEINKELNEKSERKREIINHFERKHSELKENLKMKIEEHTVLETEQAEIIEKLEALEKLKTKNTSVDLGVTKSKPKRVGKVKPKPSEKPPSEFIRDGLMESSPRRMRPVAEEIGDLINEFSQFNLGNEDAVEFELINEDPANDFEFLRKYTISKDENAIYLSCNFTKIRGVEKESSNYMVTLNHEKELDVIKYVDVFKPIIIGTGKLEFDWVSKLSVEEIREAKAFSSTILWDLNTEKKRKLAGFYETYEFEQPEQPTILTITLPTRGRKAANET